MSYNPNDPTVSVLSPLKGDYPMTVRKLCVAPGQLLQAGDRVAELLEPSGRWVSLVATEMAGQVKAVRIREGDTIDDPSELCAIYIHRRLGPDEDPRTGTVKRMSLEDLREEESNEVTPVPRAPVRPIKTGLATEKAAAPEQTGAARAFLVRHKLLVAACLGMLVLGMGANMGAKLYSEAKRGTQLSMDELWQEMRAARIAAAEFHNADPEDNLSTRAAARQRALASAREAPIQTGPCKGFFVGMTLPGVHILQGTRTVTYLDAKRGVGAFIWSKSGTPDTFACAFERR